MREAVYTRESIYGLNIQKAKTRCSLHPSIPPQCLLSSWRLLGKPPTALQGMPAMCTSAAHSHASPRAQPCSRRLCRRAPPRTHTISRSAAVSHAPRLVLASWRRLTPLARRLLHICLGAKTAPHPGRLCSQAEGRPQLLLFLATLCTTTRPRLSPRLLAPPSR